MACICHLKTKSPSSPHDIQVCHAVELLKQVLGQEGNDSVLCGAYSAIVTL